jgi:hypothetical protein
MASAPATAPTLPQAVGDALAEADRLAAADRRLEAVAMLTEANRVDRHPEIDRRLVQLRHSAFAELDRSGGLDSWPPDYPDPFPGVQGPPEVGPDDLSPEVLGGAMVNHGCLLVRGLVREPHLERLVQDIDRTFEASARHQAGAPPEETFPWFTPFKPDPGFSTGFGRQWVLDGGGVWTVDSPPSMFDLLEAFADVHLDDVLTGYLGERPALSVKKSTLRLVPTDTGTDWHQDGAFLGEGIRTVNVWLSLSDCGVDAPGLDLVPLRLPEVVETGTGGAAFDWSVGPDTVAAITEGTTEVVSPRFAPGDALLFDELFLHRTGVTPGMTRSRYAIESWFFAASRYPLGQVPIVF